MQAHRHRRIGGEQAALPGIHRIDAARRFDIVNPDGERAAVGKDAKGHASAAPRRGLNRRVLVDATDAPLGAPRGASSADKLYAVFVLALFVAHSQGHEHVLAAFVLEQEAGAGVDPFRPG